jgi:hypothetical protein
VKKPVGAFTKAEREQSFRFQPSSVKL